MSTLTDTFNSLALKLGMSSKLFKLFLLLLMLPVGTVLLGLLLIVHKIVSIGRNVRSWIVTETGLLLLILASAMLLGFAGWTAYDHLQERHISIAAGSRTAENYRLAQALKTVTARHYPHIRMAILEIDGAAGEAGLLEKGVVQLAIAPGDLPAGRSARSVAVLAGSLPRVLLARHDVDARIVYALTQMLTQLSDELAAAVPVGKAAPQPRAASIQQPTANLHPGAAAFYDQDKTPFVARRARLVAFVAAGLVLLGLWTWQLVRRARRNQKGQEESQESSFASPAGREPWTFSKILLESVAEPAAPLPPSAIAPNERSLRRVRRNIRAFVTRKKRKPQEND